MQEYDWDLSADLPGVYHFVCYLNAFYVNNMFHFMYRGQPLPLELIEFFLNDLFIIKAVKYSPISPVCLLFACSSRQWLLRGDILKAYCR